MTNPSQRGTCSSSTKHRPSAPDHISLTQTPPIFPCEQRPHSIHTLMMSSSSEQVITICVGGTLYSTTLGVIMAVPGSYLEVLFGSQHWTPSSLLPDSKTPFIDRDGEVFRFVLAYLRSLRGAGECLLLPDSPLQLQQLQAEADFYGLPGLAAICSMSLHCQGGKQARLRAQVTELLQQQQQDRQQGLPPVEGLNQNNAAADVTAGTGQPTPPTHQQQQQSSLQQPSADQVKQGVPLHTAVISRLSLANAASQAHSVHSSQQLQWSDDKVLQEHAGCVFKHLVSLPLADAQPDLVAALAQREPGTVLEFALAYYPVGDTRIAVTCRLLPSGVDQAHSLAAAAAAAIAAGSSAAASPHISPRGAWGPAQPRRATVSEGLVGPTGDAVPGSATGQVQPVSGAVSPEAAGAAVVAAAAAAAAAAVSSYSNVAAVPGPGWGDAVVYHKHTIKETADKFVLTWHSPGHSQKVEELDAPLFQPAVKAYSALHKLCVQQCPRASVAGLVWWLLESGFSKVKLSTALETYHVGRNTFKAFTSIVACHL